MSEKHYECIKNFEVEIYIDDEPTDEYFTVKKRSVWKTDLKTEYGLSDVYLLSCDNNADYTWIEISHDKLKECFKECEQE